MEWLKNNFNILISCVGGFIVLINIILLIKKGVPLKKLLKVIGLVPSLINSAESIFLSPKQGDNKHEFVKSSFNDLLVEYGLEKYKKYIDIDKIIEEVLSTPQKKLSTFKKR